MEFYVANEAHPLLLISNPCLSKRIFITCKRAAALHAHPCHHSHIYAPFPPQRRLHSRGLDFVSHSKERILKGELGPTPRTAICLFFTWHVYLRTRRPSPSHAIAACRYILATDVREKWYAHLNFLDLLAALNLVTACPLMLQCYMCITMPKRASSRLYSSQQPVRRSSTTAGSNTSPSLPFAVLDRVVEIYRCSRRGHRWACVCRTPEQPLSTRVHWDLVSARRRPAARR